MNAFILKFRRVNASTLAIVNVVFYVLMIAINIMAETLPINGVTTGEVSAMYFNLLIPAPFTFAIWGVIYLFLGLFGAYCFGVLSKSDSYKKFISKIGWLFAISCSLNSLWIILWHYQFMIAAFIVIVLLLADLMFLFAKLYYTGFDLPVDKICVFVPFSIYLGWLLSATAGNAAALYAYTGSPEAYSQDWTTCMMFILLTIDIIFLCMFSAFGVAIAGIWTFIGILSRHISEFNLTYSKVVVFCLFAITLLFVSCVIKFIKRFKPKKN